MRPLPGGVVMPMRIRCILIFAVLAILAHVPDAGAFLPRDPIVLSMQIIVNDLDGPARTACRTEYSDDSQFKNDWWVAIGEATAHPESGLQHTGHEIRCGKGPVTEARPELGLASGGEPYLIAGITTKARIHRKMEDERVLQIVTSATVEMLTGFGAGGEPLREPSVVERDFYFSRPAVMFIPLLVESPAGSKASGIHEVFLEIRASTRPAETNPVWGAITILSDADQADVLLDGGPIGTVRSGAGTVLQNVSVGLHELRVRDNAGREVADFVQIRPGRTSVVELLLSRSAGKGTPFTLEPLGKNEQGFEEYRRAIDGAVVVRVPPGEFLMGNKRTERTPLEHRVYVSEFLIDKTGVTWGQYKRFAAATGVPLPAHDPYWGMHDDHPAVYVTWGDARSYCEWSGGRLPTEAEREKGARGTDERMYPWGEEEPTPDRGVFRRTWGHEATGAVGARPAGASPYGLLDMGGNVWEWCADWYEGDYYETSPLRDPKGPATGHAHVVRGGSWDSRPTVLSSSCRSWGHRGYADGDFGFRCAMSAPE